MNKKIVLIAVVAAILLATGAFAQRSDRPVTARDLGRVTEVMNYIRDNYVEEVPLKKLINGALTGMLKSLDPYSQFLDEKAYEDLKVDTDGKFGGLGVEVSLKNGMLHVIAPLDGGPAEAAGVRAGDSIIKIDNKPTRDQSLDESVKKMRGEPGSSVKLTLMRENENRLIEISVPRAVIKVKSVKEAKILEGGVGYIKLSAFQERSFEDFKDALDRLQTDGARGLILDLRNNAGGLFAAAVDIASEFVPQGEVVVSTKGRVAAKNTVYRSKNKEPRRLRPLVLLVNHGSASGSEILAGAVQDYGLGTIIGTKTYGKGLVQTLTPLTDGTAVRMTTSRYYTPKGRLIHELGVEPDVLVEASEDPKGDDIQLKKAVALALADENP